MDKKYLEISGWAFLNKIDVGNESKYIVLKNEVSKKDYNFSTTEVKQNDVSKSK